MINIYKKKINTTLEELKEDLKNVQIKKDVSYIWNISDYKYLIDYAKKMVDEAEKSILIYMAAGNGIHG